MQDQENNLEDVKNRLLNHTELTESEILEFYTMGLYSIPNILNFIYKNIDDKGLKSSSKKFNNLVINSYFQIIESEFHGITNLFYAFRIADKIPIAHINLYQKGYQELEKLEKKLIYPEEELNCDILNQKQLIQLFTALAEANVFTSSPNLLAESLANATAYSEKSIKRVINQTQSTNGGFKKEEKEYLKKVINQIIDDF